MIKDSALPEAVAQLKKMHLRTMLYGYTRRGACH